MSDPHRCTDSIPHSAGRPICALVHSYPHHTIHLDICTDLQYCSATLTVTGGNLMGAGAQLPLDPGSWDCPPGSYYHGVEVCAIW